VRLTNLTSTWLCLVCGCDINECLFFQFSEMPKRSTIVAVGLVNNFDLESLTQRS